MKRLILLTALTLLLSSTNAQKLHYGFFMGTNISTMKLGTELYLNNDYDNCNKSFSLGFREGVFVEYSFLNFLGIQGEFSFGEYGYRMNLHNKTTDEILYNGMTIYETTISEGEGKTILNSISFSLSVKFYLLKQRLAIDFGAQPNWVLSAYRKESLILDKTITLDNEVIGQERSEKNIANSIPFNPDNISIIGGATYYINTKMFVSARYMFGLRDNFIKEVGYLEGKEYTTKNIKQLSKDRVIQVTLGFRFR